MSLGILEQEGKQQQPHVTTTSLNTARFHSCLLSEFVQPLSLHHAKHRNDTRVPIVSQTGLCHRDFCRFTCSPVHACACEEMLVTHTLLNIHRIKKYKNPSFVWFSNLNPCKMKKNPCLKNTPQNKNKQNPTHISSRTSTTSQVCTSTVQMSSPP